MSHAPDNIKTDYERRTDGREAKHLLTRAALAPMFAVALFIGYAGALATALGIIFLLGAFPELGLPRGEKIVLLAIGPPLAVCGYAISRVYRWLLRKYAQRTPPSSADRTSHVAE